MATIDELRQEPHWSYSALNTYLNICQAQFMYRYVEQAEVERTSACLPFGKAFHSALTAQAWECMMGGSLTRDEIVDRFEEAFKIEADATPNLIYKEGENFDTVIDLAVKMLDAALANWSDYYTIKGVAQAFRIDVPGLDKPLIGEYDQCDSCRSSSMGAITPPSIHQSDPNTAAGSDAGCPAPETAPRSAAE